MRACDFTREKRGPVPPVPPGKERITIFGAFVLASASFLACAISLLD